jgi:hypothetical protein
MIDLNERGRLAAISLSRLTRRGIIKRLSQTAFVVIGMSAAASLASADPLDNDCGRCDGTLCCGSYTGCPGCSSGTAEGSWSACCVYGANMRYFDWWDCCTTTAASTPRAPECVVYCASGHNYVCTYRVIGSLC